MFQKVYIEEIVNGVLQYVPVTALLCAVKPGDKVVVAFSYGDGFTEAEGVVEAMEIMIHADNERANVYHVLLEGEKTTTLIEEHQLVQKI